MMRDDYDEGAGMAAAAVHRSICYAIETIVKELNGIFSLKEERTSVF